MLKEKNSNTGIVAMERHIIYSQYLERDVLIDMYLPKVLPAKPSLLLINDGQDLPTMLFPFDKMLHDLIDKKQIEPLICVGINCGEERKLEYGTAYSPNFEGWGSKAGLYSKFVFDELLPYIRKACDIASFKDKSFAGFSLGGLSALDIVWNNANEFSRVGVFSGSLWWRRKSYDDGYDDEKDRLMHLQVLKGTFYPWLQFFIECGTKDETADRNNNGIIDSIDDALDLIVELKAKGYTDEHIQYLQIEGGKHDVATWCKAFPAFLKWGWGI
ncbi:alpha/beta hydrolase [Parasediminibacterium sp. JCM 36343]|uniref:alpha/beta hydrolase n=1 Tax=Parasediminibacterium sp. JCM 36343 TaxID=3374279 RepID=UPI00397839B5